MNIPLQKTTCGCIQAQSPNAQSQPAPKGAKSTFRALKILPPAMMSIIIAFFPKCPVCWAIYMSMFSGIGLAKLPYLGWLLPVFMILLGIHLLLLIRNIPRFGSLPFALSLTGSTLILLNRFAFSGQVWLLYPGIAMIIGGSFLNSFFSIRRQILTKKI